MQDLKSGGCWFWASLNYDREEQNKNEIEKAGKDLLTRS